MAKPNYSFEKRRKEIAKRKKKEEKRLRKLAKKEQTAPDGAETVASQTGGMAETPNQVPADRKRHTDAG